MRTLFWDVDTQVDFMDPGGALYVKGAEEIVPNLARLTELARRIGALRGGSVAFHSPDDPELSPFPDLHETFPPHCLAGTPGAAKIGATRPLHPLWIPSRLIRGEALCDQIRDHSGEVFVQKQRFDVFSNPNMPAVLEALSPERVVVYGAALDVSGRLAIEGFLKTKGLSVCLVEDAAKPMRPEGLPELVKSLRRRGVEVMTTEKAIGALDPGNRL